LTTIYLQYSEIWTRPKTIIIQVTTEFIGYVISVAYIERKVRSLYGCVCVYKRASGFTIQAAGRVQIYLKLYKRLLSFLVSSRSPL